MKGQFVSHSPSQALLVRIRWLLSGLIAIITLLVVTVAYLVGIDDQQVVVAAEPTPTEMEIGRDMLAPRERIEVGEQITSEKLVWVSAPAGASGFLLPEHAQSIVGQFASRTLEMNSPIFIGDFTAQQPSASLPIPAGYRAISLTLDTREIAGGFIESNSRVDVLWKYSDSRGERKIATIVHAVRVLSATPNGKQGSTIVTLLTSEADAKVVELARSEGGVSLALLGKEELLPTKRNADPVGLLEILRRGGEPIAVPEPKIDGRLFTTDPRTGRQMEFVLQAGGWKARP